jgi:hypothetical protein
MRNAKLESEKENRLARANQFILAIASCGRQFFRKRDTIAHIERSPGGMMFIHDEHSRKRVAIRPKAMDWRGFNNGGTLRALIECLADYIRDGRTIDLTCKHWGYGDDAEKVLETGRKLGIVRESPDAR